MSNRSKLFSLFIYFLCGIFITFKNIDSKENHKTPKNTPPPIPNIEKEKKKNNVKNKRNENIRLVLKYGTSEKVRKVLGHIPKLKKEDQISFIPEIEKLLETDDILIQIKAVNLIGNVSWENLDTKIIPFLQSNSRVMVYTALNSINKKKIIKALPTMRKMIMEMDFQKKSNYISDMILAFADLEDQEMAKFFFAKLKDQKVRNSYKIRIVQYLTSIRYQKKEVMDHFVSVLQDDQEDIKLRAICAKAIGRLEFTSAKDSLKKELEKIDQTESEDRKNELRSVRLWIISSLIMLKDEEAEKILFQMIRDPIESIRVKAVRELGKINPKKYKEMLEYKAEYDPSIRVQRAAKEALKKDITLK